MTPLDHLRALPASPDAEPHPLLDAIVAAGTTDDQAAYARRYAKVFDTLDELDARLADQRHLGGAEPSDDDWALFVVLVRFDLVFHGLYKLNRQLLADFDQLGGWLRDLWQRAGVADTIDLGAVRAEAYRSHPELNPKGTVPVTLPDLQGPHDRHRFDRAARRRAGVEAAGDDRRGAFQRGTSAHRHWVGDPDFPAEAGRYHLIVADNCPWSHRAKLGRAVLGLQDVISCDTVWFRRDPDHGWQFRPDQPGFDADRLHGARYVRELYRRVGSSESSVPLLWDKERDTVVNNESAEILRMFDVAFRPWATGPRLVPDDLVDVIDDLNAWIYQDLNNGSYRAGFASSQAAYEEAHERFFAAWDRVDRRLQTHRFLAGDRFTEADLRLFPTMFRFDAVYHTRFKLDRRRVKDTPSLVRWMTDVWSIPGVAEASDLERCKQGYFGRHGNEVVPVGPAMRSDVPVAR